MNTLATTVLYLSHKNLKPLTFDLSTHSGKSKSLIKIVSSANKAA